MFQKCPSLHRLTDDYAKYVNTTTKPRKLLVWEPNGSGHRFMYVKFIAKFAKVNSIAFEIHTTLQARALSEWKAHGLGAYPFRLSANLSELSKAVSAETCFAPYIIIPDADRWLHKLLGHWKLFRKTPISLLLMRPFAGKTISSKLSHVAKFAILVVVRLVFRNVEIFALTNPGKSLPARYRALRTKAIFDPVEWNPTMNKNELGLGPEQTDMKLFLIAGELSERKYISEILNAWDSIQPENALLILVGEISSPFVSELRQLLIRNTSILHVDEYVSNATFDSWIDVADFIFVLHRNPGSSGVSLKATLSTHGAVICGGLKSNLKTMQNYLAKYVVLEEIGVSSISNLLRQSDIQVTIQKVPSHQLDGLSWAKSLCEAPEKHKNC